MRTIAEHQQPPRTLHDLALVDLTRHFQAVIAVDHGLDPAAFAGTAEQHDRVTTPRSHAAIVPISRGQRKALYVATSLHQAFDALKRQHQTKRYANFQQVFLALRRFGKLGGDIPPRGSMAVMRRQVLLDQIPHVGEGR
jgi:hypothetical protein